MIYIDKSAVNLSRSAIRIPHSQSNNVRRRAGNGSPRYVFENRLRIGIKSSLATACNRRGAPTKKNKEKKIKLKSNKLICVTFYVYKINVIHFKFRDGHRFEI